MKVKKVKRMNEDEMISLFLKEKIESKDIDVFIENNSIDSVDRDGRTLIFTAIVEKQLSVVNYLIDKGCSINLQDKKGFTPLHFSIIHDTPEIAKLLIQNGADINLQDKWGNTPLKRAMMTKLVHRDELIKLLNAKD